MVQTIFVKAMLTVASAAASFVVTKAIEKKLEERSLRDRYEDLKISANIAKYRVSDTILHRITNLKKR